MRLFAIDNFFFFLQMKMRSIGFRRIVDDETVFFFTWMKYFAIINYFKPVLRQYQTDAFGDMFM